MEVTGAIEGLCVTMGSGIGELVVRDDDGHIHVLVCEAGPTTRAVACFAPHLLRGGTSVRFRLRDEVRVTCHLDPATGVLAAIVPEDVDLDGGGW